MIKKILFLLILTFYSIAVRAGGMYFVQNKGQWDADVLFRTDVPGGFLFLKKQSFVYTFYDASRIATLHGKGTGTVDSNLRATDVNTITAHGVEVKMVGSSATTMLKPSKPVQTRFSYFLGEGASAGDVQGFEEVMYENIYPGINLRIYMHNAVLKYEFIVGADARVGDIAMKYEGASDLALNGEGQVVVKTPLSTFKENVPYSFQKRKEKTVEIKSGFSLKDGNTLSFLLPDGYDKSQSLIIDPELIFSTYSGSTADNWGHTATYDDEGNLYSAGTVFGTNFPATTGAFQVRFQGLVDVAVMKFSPDGSNLLYATYLGGSSTDIPNSLVVNSKKELIILGTTSSRNFPVSNSAFQKEFGGGSAVVPISGLNLPNGSDIFMAKLSADGKQLLASSYLGGSGNDGLTSETGVTVKNYGDSFRGEVVVDKDDQIYAVTSTNSGNFPLRNADKMTLSGRQDGVLFKFSSNLESLLWSTYLGGDGHDAAFSLKVTATGDVYVAGITQSKDLKAHTSAYQTSLKGTEDGFIARYTGQKLTNLSYLGTDKEDGAYLLDLDQTGNVYVYGTTYGTYPVSSGVYSNAGSGQFIHALDAGLSKTVLSAVIGSGRGVPDISPTAFLVNECGNIYIAGWGGDVNVVSSHNAASSTRGLPVTTDAIQRQTSGNNFYIAILEEGAKSLLYATFFGSLNTSAQGDHVDGGTSRFDKNGVIYHATCACGGSNFPVTPQAWSRTNRSENCNNAAFKIDIDHLKADFDVYQGDTKDVLKGCAPLALSFANMSEGGVDYIWDVNGSTISREEGGAEFVFRNPGEYTVTLRAYNRLSCKRMDVAQKKIVVESINATVSRDTTVCENSTLQLRASGGATYKWTPSTDMVNPETANPTITVTENGTYKVEISSAAGCKVEREVKVSVEKKNDFVAMPDVEICAGSTTTLTVTGEAARYRWLAVAGFPETVGKTVKVNPTVTTTYTIEGVYADGCRPLRQITVRVDRSFEPDFEIVRSGETCNEPFSYGLRNQGSESLQYEWNMGVGSVLSDLHVENFVYDSPGAYAVTLTAYNAAGCALSVTKQLQAEPPFILSNVITPNGDGKNDFFVVPIAGSSLEVYNRWGKKIFTNPDYKNDWGKGISNGTYFYVVDTPNGRHCKGWLEVLE
ncbi:gliding motility-associated C-terminal domain-containing protein [Dyadobacter luteus]|uniref:gliding motility-associated C-terminal domain-containing protein n=1 Tax=Dyadobacter luteus TaxID=2259619 RepID=UPI001E5F3694|nr:gliding motility-associated C-terminal domain-containing protein [Dyadobacter luteus]